MPQSLSPEFPAAVLPVARYAAPSRLLHWLTAALVVVIIIFGIWIKFFEPHDEPFKLRLYNIHESCGVLVFLLTLIRIVNRHLNPPPPLPADTPALIRFAASTSHIALYVLLVLMPIVGFLATNAWGFPLSLFNVLPPLPSPVDKNEELAKILSFVHLCGAVTIILLIGAHLMGVIYHTFVRKDGLLRRMI